MSGDKRWTVGHTTDGGPVLEYGYLPLGVGFGMLNAFGPDDAAPAYAALVADVRDAARLRSLAAWFDSDEQRTRSHPGNVVAAMLRDGGE